MPLFWIKASRLGELMLIVYLAFALLNYAAAFNFDVHMPIYKRREVLPITETENDLKNISLNEFENAAKPNSIYFGYSVAQHFVRSSRTPL
jgi:hypothetical protein